MNAEESINLPIHVAMIMDGNGRWALSRGLPRLAGHRAGVENLRRIITACVEFGVRYLTIYAFSTENWGRPREEVDGLMFLLNEVLDKELDELNRQGVQLRHIGRLEGLSPSIQKKVREAMLSTRTNDNLILNVAFNYGGRDEIIHAFRRMLADGVKPDEVDSELVSRYLYTAGQPDPDLIIRTAGELRTSNFMLWQGAYAEYYAADVYWPDFDKDQFRLALQKFGQREQRKRQIVSNQRIRPDTEWWTDATNAEPNGIARTALAEAPAIAVARIHDVSNRNTVTTGRAYILEAGIWSRDPGRFLGRDSQEYGPGTNVEIQIAVRADHFTILPGPIATYIYRRNAPSLLQFIVQPLRDGDTDIQVDFFHKQQWLAGVAFEVHVASSLLKIPV